MTRLYALGPAGDERHAMPALVYVRLVSAVAGAGVMTELLQQLEVSLRGTTIVAGEENQGILVDAGLLEGGEQIAHVAIHLHHEIGVGVDLAGSLERGNWHDWRVRCRQRKVEKERLFRLRPFLDVGDALVEQMGQYIVDVEIRAHGALSVPTIAVLLAGNALHAVRQGRDLTGVDPNVRRHVEGSAMTVVAVETIDVGAVLDRLGKVDVLPLLFLLVDAGPVPTEVPFANHLGMVSGLLEQVGNGGPLGGNQVVAGSPQHAPGQA